MKLKSTETITVSLWYKNSIHAEFIYDAESCDRVGDCLNIVSPRGILVVPLCKLKLFNVTCSVDYEVPSSSPSWFEKLQSL